MRREMDAPHILIVGGGAGGLELAIHLARKTKAQARVTLVDRRSSHIWKPRLHEIATGLMLPAEEEASFAEQARMHGFDFALGEVSAIDPEAQRVTIASVPFPVDRLARSADDAALLPERSIDYDIAVIAIGSTINEFGIEGVRDHCFSLDSPEEAERLHTGFLALATRVRAGDEACLRVAIVGAGTTGVELAAELDTAARDLGQYGSAIGRDRLRIDLVEMADRPLAGASADTSDYARQMLADHGVKMHFGAKVTKVEAQRLLLDGGRTIDADILVWASGIRGHGFAATIPGIDTDDNDRIRCDAMLRVARADGSVFDTLFAIGDAAACREIGAEKPVPATAQAAHQQAEHLARSLSRRLRGRKLKPFRYHYRGTLVSLGSGKAVGDLPTFRAPIRIAGWSAKLAYIALYRGHLAQLLGWTRTGALTLADMLRRTATPRVKLHW